MVLRPIKGPRFITFYRQLIWPENRAGEQPPSSSPTSAISLNWLMHLHSSYWLDYPLIHGVWIADKHWSAWMATNRGAIINLPLKIWLCFKNLLHLQIPPATILGYFFWPGYHQIWDSSILKIRIFNLIMKIWKSRQRASKKISPASSTSSINL